MVDKQQLPKDGSINPVPDSEQIYRPESCGEILTYCFEHFPSATEEYVIQTLDYLNFDDVLDTWGYMLDCMYQDEGHHREYIDMMFKEQMTIINKYVNKEIASHECLNYLAINQREVDKKNELVKETDDLFKFIKQSFEHQKLLKKQSKVNKNDKGGKKLSIHIS